MIRIENLTPVIGVSSLSAAKDFYVSVLGFSVNWGDEDGAKVCGIARDGHGMMLSEFEPAGGTVWIGCEDIVPIHNLLTSAGADIIQPPTNQPWAHEFRASDGFGNTLWFGSGPLDS